MKKIAISLITIFLSINPVLAENTSQYNEENIQEYKSVYDPLENINRYVFEFNKGVDTYGIKPVTVFYKDNTPRTIQKGVSNFLSYIETPLNAINFGLQGNKEKFGDSLGRFLLNTFGFGILDFASELDIPKEKTTMGETLGYWGVPEGPYVVLPLLGGNTLRDNAANIAFEMNYGITNQFNDPLKYSSIGLKVIDTRKNLLRYDGFIEEAAIDEYSFIKQLIVNQKRKNIEDLKEESLIEKNIEPLE